MKRLAILIFLIFILAGSKAPAEQKNDEDALFRAMHAGGLKNGVFMEQEDPVFAVMQMEYVEGVREAFGYLGIPTIERNFSGYTNEEAVKAIRTYYKNNPDKKGRSVIEVVVSGCKDKNRFNVITEKMETDEYLNGFYLLSKDMDNLAQVMYLQGLCDASAKLDIGTMRKYYGAMQHPDIWDAMHNFYEKHPEKRERPVIDVLLSGMEGELPEEEDRSDRMLIFDDPAVSYEDMIDVNELSRQ